MQYFSTETFNLTIISSKRLPTNLVFDNLKVTFTPEYFCGLELVGSFIQGAICYRLIVYL